MSARSKRPVFVLGCPRSGTTLLYHMILSAGNFAVYRSESMVFNLLAPCFGDLSVRRNRQALMKAWLASKFFTTSGLDAKEIKSKILEECRSGGDFLRILMEEIARKQGVERWAECTPDHILYLEAIRKSIPDALILHILRDGRDVALSLEKQKWIRPLPWDKEQSLLVAGLYWQWTVNYGRRSGRTFGPDYMEVSFEDLIQQPHSTLARIGDFIQHDLNYERIKKVGIGSMSQPNTSFETDSPDGFQPTGRWRAQFPQPQLERFETMAGSTLEELGYPLSSEGIHTNGHALTGMRVVYESLFSTKLWLKQHTPLAKFLMSDDLSWL